MGTATVILYGGHKADRTGPTVLRHDSIIERVARAIWGEEPIQHFEQKFEDLIPMEQEAWRVMARAAVAAMREPTEAMLGSTDKDGLLGGYGYGDDCYEANAGMVWQAMIDAALS